MFYRTTALVLTLLIFLEFYFIFVSDELNLRKWVVKLTGTNQIDEVLVGNDISFQKRNTPGIKPNEELTSSSAVYCILEQFSFKGRQDILLNAPSIETLEKSFINLYPGGRFKPDDCQARDKVAIIVPFRDRQQHLRIFLLNLHPLLQRQKLNYGIYIVEQMENKPFNRAMLMNIGYVEALKQYDYDCFIFHDVDLIPEDDRNPYECPENPRHMSVAVDKFKYEPLYEDLFGGVSAMSKKHMELVNGFSNSFWGWGAEDDDMASRIKYHNLKITRYPSNISRYTMLTHEKATPSRDLIKRLKLQRKRFDSDGLNSLKYQRVDIIFKKLYTWVLVRV